MYFPVAGIEVSPWVPPVVAFCVSLCTSMGGVSGAFLLLPFQMSVLGYVSPSVSATNQVYNIVAIPSGVYRYLKERRMVWPLTYATAVGTLPGVLIGAIIRVKWLPDPRNFKMFAAMVLAYIGLRLVRDTYFPKTRPAAPSPATPVRQAAAQAPASSPRQAAGSGCLTTDMAVTDTCYSMRRVEFTFQGQRHGFSTGGVLLMSFVVGIVGGVYGIGGGSFIAPFFVAFFNLPVYTVAGAALMGTFLTSVCGVLFYQALQAVGFAQSAAPDWSLGVLFGMGGFAGMYVGARCQKYVPAKYIKGFLAACIIFLAVRYVGEFFL